MRNGLFVAVFVVVAGLWGCSKEPPVPPPPPPVPETVQPVLRFCDQQYKEAVEAKHPPILLRYSPDWEITGAGEVRPQPDDCIILTKGPVGPEIVFKQPIKAKKYNVLRVRMRQDAGELCGLVWENEVEPDFLNHGGVQIKVLPDNSFHTYTIPLYWPSSATWLGESRRFLFLPAVDTPANIELEWIEFDYVPPPEPMRVTIEGETRPAFSSITETWHVAVPPGAVLDTAVAMARHSWNKYGTDGARFVCTVSAPEIPDTPVVDITLTPTSDRAHRQWVPIQGDLSAFAGKEVALRFDVIPVMSQAGTVGIWGNPVIFSNQSPKDSIPVILISCDTVSASHLSCYGYARKTSPWLEEFAKEAVLFENTVVQDAWTLPSHISMLTGLYPKTHRVTPAANLAEARTTLGELLGRNDYVTAGFGSIIWWLEPWRGFSQGFDCYSVPQPYRDIFATNALAEQWLDQHPTRRFFLFVHNYDAHSKTSDLKYTLPYTPDDPRFLQFSKEFPNPPTFAREGQEVPAASDMLVAVNQGKMQLSEDETKYLVALYDDSILQVDFGIYEFLEDIKARGLYDQALIVVTADHGEAFGEHGMYMHEDAYEQCGRVPLIIKFPNGRFAGTRFKPVVQGIDIFPTIRDVLGLAADDQVEGQSLLALLEKRAQPLPWGYTRRHVMAAVRSDEWKLIDIGSNGTREFYNLAQDPGERNNLYAQALPPMADHEKELETFYVANPEGWHMRFTAGTAPVTYEVTLNADDRVVSMESVPRGQSDVFRIGKNGRTVAGTVSLAPGQSKEMIIRAVAREAHMDIKVTADVEFVASVGSSAAVSGNEANLVLDASGEGVESQPAPPEAAMASVAVWYVLQKEEGAAARDLSQDEVNQLEALGYLQ